MRTAPLLLALAALAFAPAPLHAAPVSGVTRVEVTGTQPVGDVGGVAYVRTWGVVHGAVAPSEQVVGLDAQPKTADGAVAYAAEFELIAPARGQPANHAVFVEAENRGSPLLVDVLDRLIVSGKPWTAAYPSGLGSGFLFRHHISYARVQWQTGIAAGVPETAQGIGEVIVRDFGRLLAGRHADGADLGAYPTRVLAGVSQSAWFVDSFIAEGFNADPSTGGPVFGGALAIDGTGNWMAINQLAQRAGFAQSPYLNARGAPLTPDRLLTRPRSDPFYLDVANYNDFFRVRASLSSEHGFPARMRRYDWPSPHAPGSKAMFGSGCNGGVAVPLDPIGYGPYARALVVELAHQLGAEAGSPTPAVPPSTLFALAPAPADTSHFNPLPGAAAKIPALDARGQPVGGVRFPEVEVPIGEPGLPLPHVGLDSIHDTCGNALEWRPYSAAKLHQLYGSEAGYLARYAVALDRLIVAGFVLEEDRAEMLETAARLYRAAPPA
jgi:hypothetical protein